MADPVTLGLIGLAAALITSLLRSLETVIRSRMEARLERARREGLAAVLRAMPPGGAVCERRTDSLLVIVSLPTSTPELRQGVPRSGA
jgi:hypothetical protein